MTLSLSSRWSLGLLAVVLAGCGQTTPTTSAPTTSAKPSPAAAIAPLGLFDTTPVLVPTIISRQPHSMTAFTEGLQLVGNTLYESTGLTGKSTVKKTELTTGLVQQRPISLSGAFGEGLTILNNKVYQLTYTEGKVLMYDATTLNSLGQMSYSGEGWGMTNDGKSLIMSNGSSTLYWRDPVTFAITKKMTIYDGWQMVSKINELEYVNGQIYANIFSSNRIARIDAATGKVNAWIDVSALTKEAKTTASQKGYSFTANDVTNGIAYNPTTQTFYLTGKDWPTLFEVTIK